MIQLKTPTRRRPALETGFQDMLDLLVRIFPFMLVMWSLAGALYPAVDCAPARKNAARWRRCSSARPAAKRSSGASS